MSTGSVPRPASAGLSWLNPLAIALHLARHRHLVGQLAWRQSVARYRASWLGLLWSLIDPLLMFLLYLFVFTVVFEVRWGSAGESHVTFALNLFAGLILYNLMAETLNAAPTLIVAHRSYVQRTLFPVEVLPVCRLLANSLQFGLSLAILLLAVVVVDGRLPWTLILLPLALLPLFLLTLGLAFFLSALGVFVRDTENVVRPAMLALLFLSPIFYPLARLPDSWQAVLRLNPLAHLIEDFRRVVLDGALPAWPSFVLVTLLALAAASGGFAWFMRAKRAFADVI